MKKILPILMLAGLLLPIVFLGACTPLGFATGAAATTGAAAAREGGVRGTLTDLQIQAAINDLWFQYDVETFAKLDMTVNQGRVLITGVVQSPEHRLEAVRLAWQPVGVKQVINEIQLADSPGVTAYARDAWISTRLRTALTFDSKVQSINYSIDVVKGNVYLMGVAQNQAELDHVIEKARTIPDVRRVVSYVKLVGESLGPTQTENQR
ncbi:MAG TPA: BON domain-containing protein [Alphaproteobacteria bacterium]|nr:BON domain-containing protein [Alphaproteobacteria bacterium]